VIALLLLACNPIASCPSLAVDCCRTDAQCASYYADKYPYCIAPGPDGTCGECLTSDDCNGAPCLTDRKGIGSYCGS
jgi:hypothetical protein